MCWQCKYHWQNEKQLLALRHFLNASLSLRAIPSYFSTDVEATQFHGCICISLYIIFPNYFSTPFKKVHNVWRRKKILFKSLLGRIFSGKFILQKRGPRTVDIGLTPKYLFHNQKQHLKHALLHANSSETQSRSTMPFGY